MIVSDVAYVDSSILLEVLLAQPGAAVAARAWDRHRQRVSSVLLEAECRTVLRRADRASALPLGLAEAERDLEAALEQLALHDVERRVLDRLAAVPTLGRCRTLDALHLATALTLRDRLGSELVVLTSDRRMAESARDLGLAVAQPSADIEVG